MMQFIVSGCHFACLAILAVLCASSHHQIWEDAAADSTPSQHDAFLILPLGIKEDPEPLADTRLLTLDHGSSFRQASGKPCSQSCLSRLLNLHGVQRS